MANPLQEIITETCTGCKGACCTEKLSRRTVHDWVLLTEGIIADADFAGTLVKRLRKESRETMRHKSSSDHKNARRQAADEFARFLTDFAQQGADQKIEKESVSELTEGIAGFANSKNRRDSPFDGIDYCGFNTMHGCMVPEYNPVICRTFLCHSSERYYRNQKDVLSLAEMNNCTYGDLIPLLTSKMPQDELCRLVEVDLTKGRPYRHIKVVFNGGDMAEVLEEKLRKRGRIIRVVEGGESIPLPKRGTAIIRKDYDLSSKEGLIDLFKKGSQVQQVFENFCGDDIYRIFLVEGDLSMVYPAELRDYSTTGGMAVSRLRNIHFLECVY